MPRPIKKKKICKFPEFTSFGPLQNNAITGHITMTVAEYETIRLIDYEGLTQEQAAQRMEVARTSVQRLYTNARKLLAQSLIDGSTLIVNGGNYIVCPYKGEKLSRPHRMAKQCPHKKMLQSK